MGGDVREMVWWVEQHCGGGCKGDGVVGRTALGGWGCKGDGVVGRTALWWGGCKGDGVVGRTALRGWGGVREMVWWVEQH